MKVVKVDLFPEELARWLSERDTATVRKSLEQCICRACSATAPPISVSKITKAEVDTLDDRYFDLQERGDADASLRAFQLARLAAAALALRSDDLEGAVYEFLHSRDSLDEAAFNKDLESG